MKLSADGSVAATPRGRGSWVHEGEMEEQQERVANVLLERSPRLNGVYRTAVDALRQPPREGCEAARISVIAHCMREIMIGLPAVMADSAIPRPKPSSGSLMGQLPDLLANHPDVDLNSDQDTIPVPQPVAKKLADLISTVVKEKGRNRSNAAALVTGGTDTRHPAIKQWMEAYEFFVGWAHLDRNYERQVELPGDDALRTAMKVVEDVIEVRAAVFFDNLRSIEAMLAEINATTEAILDDYIPDSNG